VNIKRRGERAGSSDSPVPCHQRDPVYDDCGADDLVCRVALEVQSLDCPTNLKCERPRLNSRQSSHKLRMLQIDFAAPNSESSLISQRTIAEMLHESLIRASFPGGFIHELYYKSEISSHKKWTILNIPNSAIHGRGNVNRDRCPCSGLVEPSCGDPFTFASGSGRSWNFTTLGFVPLPPSM